MSRLVVLVCFVVAFAAGLAVGFRSSEKPVPTTTQSARRVGWLTQELKLTTEQQEQMKKIWSESPWSGQGDRDERRRTLYHDRDEAIMALIRPEDKYLYDQVLKEFAEKKAAIEHEGRTAFDRAVEQTKLILDAQQRERYETILKNRPRGPGGRGGADESGGREWDRGSRGRDRRGRGNERGRQGDDRATSRPAESHPE